MDDAEVVTDNPTIRPANMMRVLVMDNDQTDDREM